jgi:cytidyltransferase-like protein
MDVLTIGTFDILHFGHIELFKKCKQISGNGKFVIGLNSSKPLKSKYSFHIPSQCELKKQL